MENADAFCERLLSILTQTSHDNLSLLLNFAGVDYISSAGLRALMLASKQAQNSKTKLAISSLQPVVIEIFQISRFDKVLHCFADDQSAINSMTQSAYNA